jgi:hypothetical protein
MSQTVDPLERGDQPGVVPVPMFKHIDEIIETFLKFDTFQIKSTAAPEDQLRLITTIRSLTNSARRDSIQLSPKLCMLPNVQGRTPAQR